MQLSLTHRGWLAVSLLALPIVGGGACGVGFRANEAAGGTGGEAPGSGAGGEATSSAGGSGTGGAEGGAGGMGGEPGEGGQGGDKGEGGRARDACPAELPGPALVEVPGPNGAFCMDAHEVTAAQYAAFVAAGPALSTDATCGWNTTYEPNTGAANCGTQDYDPVANPDLPAVCVDWCDARDYCAWAGKRLCGAHEGGPLGFDDYADPAISEWMWVCTAGGTQPFPYGATYDPTICIGDEYDMIDNGPEDHPYPVLDAPGCVGGYPGVIGMSGNVWEYEDACDTAGAGDPAKDQCRRRGGSFWDGDPTVMQCDHFGFPVTRDSVNKNDGFRCCADLPSTSATR